MACKLIATELNLIKRNGRNLLASAFVRHSSSDSCKSDIEKVTHTGQVFAEDDYRNVRFTNATRYVNENWAVKLIEEVPPIECTERVVHCDGGDGPLGHPRVYINLDPPGPHDCVYCGLRYIKKDHHH